MQYFCYLFILDDSGNREETDQFCVGFINIVNSLVAGSMNAKVGAMLNVACFAFYIDIILIER